MSSVLVNVLIPGDHRGKAIEQLARYIFKDKNRAETAQNTSVEVFLPIELLKVRH